MDKEIFPLSVAKVKQELILASISGGRALKRRLADLGLKKGTKVKVLHSHRPGPSVILIGDTRLALGHGMAQKIMVNKAST